MKNDEPYDVVVIGAGIQGAGVAQAAALQGWRVLVLEQYAKPAMGTSSKSSKLIHGGLRYLETAQFGLVKECLREREILQRIAPDLVKLTRFMIPIYSHSKRAPFWIKLGLWLYGLLGDAKPETLSSKRWAEFGMLKQEKLKAICSYEDAQTDDAQLTQAVITSAQSLGAIVKFNAKVHSFQQTKNGFSLLVDDSDTISSKEIHTKVLINAAGPWVNIVKNLSQNAMPSMEVDLVQGAHIEIDVPAFTHCFYLESPDDGRAMFVLPWKGRTMVGTTETLHTGDPALCTATQEEIEYLKRGFDYYFPKFKDAAIVDAWAGLRVLPKDSRDANKRVRDTKIITDANQDSGYYAIYGGKLTGYRATAEKVVKRIAHHFGGGAVKRTDTVMLKNESTEPKI